jgi:hypothetical protein
MPDQPQPIRIPDADDPGRRSDGTTTRASDRDERPDGKPRHTPAGADRYAAGTPGGGSAVGGLAGTNIDEGSPQNDDLEKHENGIEDTVPDEDDGGPPYAGHSGGAVGGTPAGGRARGGRVHGGLRPGGVHRGDSTIGTNPDSGAD